MPRRRNRSTKPLGRNFIRSWREYRNKTQAQLADYIGISVGHLSRIERGEKEYMQSLLEAAAEYLDADPASLLMRDPGEPEPIWSLWDRATTGERDDIRRLAEVVVTQRKRA